MSFGCSAARDAFATMDAHPVDKDAMAEMLNISGNVRKSPAPVAPITAGTVLSRTCSRPRNRRGIPPKRRDRRAAAEARVTPDRILHWEDIHDE